MDRILRFLKGYEGLANVLWILSLLLALHIIRHDIKELQVKVNEIKQSKTHGK